MKRTSLKRQSLKKKANKENEKEIRYKDLAFYAKIWISRPHRCVNCDKYLGFEPLTIFFDHILEKSKYPELRWEESNIQLLCFECHQIKTNKGKLKQ